MTRPRFYAYLGLAALGISGGAYAFRDLLEKIPPIHTLEEYTPSLATRLYDVRGELIAELFTERRARVPLSQIPVDLQNAVIAVEDDRFFNHWGISPRGIVRAALSNLRHRQVVQGGSTITQQLSKLIFLTQERTLARKLREALVALQMERNLSKEEILELYLNQVYLGQGAYGVVAAAQSYFGKELSQLNLPECALLAGLIQRPSAYSPFAQRDRALRRRQVVLARMYEEGFVQPQEFKEALVALMPALRPPAVGVRAPYFVERIRRRLEPKYGFHVFWKGGLEIHTTLDLRFQDAAEKVMEKSLADYDVKAEAEFKKRLEEEGVDFSVEGSTYAVGLSTEYKKIQGAFVLMDLKSGAIRALIGGRGFGETQFNRATQAYRQPGSTFKPFVWGAALQNGMTSMSLVEDAPLAYYYDGKDWRRLEGIDENTVSLATAPFAQNPDFDTWVPNNFDNKYLGVITLKRALALSRNLCSVRLIDLVGPPQVVELARKVGIHSSLEPVPALGLGASVVSPLELSAAFGTFANGGVKVQSHEVVKVLDPEGKVLEEHVPSEAEAISPQLAYLTTHLMRGVVEAGTGGYARRLKRPLAGKTGTTNENRDLWFIGFTPDLVAGAWMGYDDSRSSLKDWTGGRTVVPWWTEIMGEVLQEYPPRDFPVPEGISFAAVDSDTGMLALPSCPRRSLEPFLKGTEPTAYCDADHSKPLVLAPPPQAAQEVTYPSLGSTAPASLPLDATGYAPLEEGGGGAELEEPDFIF